MGPVQSKVIFTEHIILTQTKLVSPLSEQLGSTETLALIDLEEQTITRFSADMSIAFKELISPEIPIPKWQVVADRGAKLIVQIEKENSTNGLDLLKVTVDKLINSCSGAYISKEYFLLYNLDIPPHVGSLCGIPTHELELPSEYQHFRYIYKQWTEYHEADGEISAYPFIETEYEVEPKFPFPYSIAELKAVALVAKEAFMKNKRF